ncbi:hypothetical protein GE061_016638 [Apolygus lucorum]|uniref:Uncharacterized protein n=1 Tax=Apolygus lucorum TaxID=248454 RepID=A0A8S9XJF0_APOLU|nr:hypothetical protein GE061_016638 [Apolygus lucorum]
MFCPITHITPAGNGLVETSGMDLCSAVGAVSHLLEKSSHWHGTTGKAVKDKLEGVLSKNPGWSSVVQIAKILQGEDSSWDSPYSPKEISTFKFLLTVSCDVERSFSALKGILSDRRHCFTPDNLERVIVIQYNM